MPKTAASEKYVVIYHPDGAGPGSKLAREELPTLAAANDRLAEIAMSHGGSKCWCGYRSGGYLVRIQSKAGA